MNPSPEQDTHLSESVAIHFIRTGLSTIQVLTDGCIDYVQTASGPAGDLIETLYDVVQDEVKKNPKKLLLGALFASFIGGNFLRRL